jgi:DNA polymerase-3 subunit gamma/tau
VAPGETTAAPSAEPASAPARAAAAAHAQSASEVGTVTTQQVKDAWPQILDAVQRAKRSAWMVVFTAQVRALNDDVLTLSFPSDNDVQSFRQPDAAGSLGVSEYLRQAIVEVLGIRVKFIARADAGPASNGSPRPSGGAPAAPAAETWPGAEAPGAAPTTARSAAVASTTTPSAAVEPAADPRSEQAVNAPSSTPAASVTEWTTVTIPSSPSAAVVSEPVVGAVATMERPANAAPTAPAPAPTAPAADEPPFDDVPPPETEPPFEPPVPDEPTDDYSAASDAAPAATAAPAAPAAAQSAPAQAPRSASSPGAGTRTPTFQQPQRYGEAVVREILGATFIEEQPAPPTPGMR